MMSARRQNYVTTNLAIRVTRATYERLVEMAGSATPGELSWAVSRVLDKWAESTDLELQTQASDRPAARSRSADSAL